MSFVSPVAYAARALLSPWSLGHRSERLSPFAAISLAGVFVTAAVALSTLLSTWTYLAGKGLLVSTAEMDMGRDDLPADSVSQVLGALAGSAITWTCLLAGAVLVCVAVADALYHHDREAWRMAIERTSGLTIWFVVWAVLIIAANSVRQGEGRHPAAAIRAYAQLNQRWFRGSSAENPGPIEREPLVAHGRVRILAIVFPLVWSVAMPRPTRGRRRARVVTVLLALMLSWLAWASVWRLLPWVAIDAFAG